ncbi:MAG: DegV family protein [Candidatus Eremiobacteraeota bacterium]|nr:DegV family protein [Candidatus Eremiobacteraeota bacterium]
MAVAIVTDSTADIDSATASDLGVDVVPLFVSFGNKRYTDGEELTRAEFYRKLESEKHLPMTSAPSSKMFEDVFAKHVALGHEIVCVVLAATFSGTINAAQAAARRFPDAVIRLVDSLTVAGGLGLQVRRAAELARAGAEIKEIEQSLSHDRETQHAFATLPDLSHAVRSGRIGRPAAMLGTLMKVVPVLKIVGGIVEREALVRTFSRAQEVMIEATLRSLTDTSAARIMVMHANVHQVAVELVEMVKNRLSASPKFLGISEAGPVLAVHAGAGAVGIFCAEA